MVQRQRNCWISLQVLSNRPGVLGLFFIAKIKKTWYSLFIESKMNKTQKLFMRTTLIALLCGVLGVAIWIGYDFYLSLPCPDNRPLRDSVTRFCYACDSDERIRLDPTLKESFQMQCAVCAQRETDKYLGYFCVLKCPPSKPLRGFEDACYSCEKQNPVYVGYTYESACKTCDNREFNHGFCFKKCHKEKPFRDFQGACFSKGDI